MDTTQPQIVESIAPAPPKKMTLAEVRAQLDGKTGRRFWKNLDELAETPAFHALMEEEFPKQGMGGVGEWVDSVSRRGFLKVMGASLALAGLAGCTKQPDEPIYPYVKQPEDLILGKPMYFATAFPFPTGAIPVLVKSDAFRPIKIEGNPEHPMSKGKSDSFSQATLLGLYDPDRSQHVMRRGETSDWSTFQTDYVNSMAAKKASGGAGVYFLSETITSPTVAGQWKMVQAAYPQATLVQYEPVNRDAAMTASKAVFGDFVDAQYKLDDADVILSLDADFLSGIAHPGFLPLAASYAKRHRYSEDATMNRMYVVESMPTVTGFKAEHRLALKPSELAQFAQALAGNGAFSSAASQSFAAAVLADLKKSAGRCVVIPGEQAPAAVHAAAAMLNAQLGNVGKTVIYTETVNPLPTIQGDAMKALVADMNAGKVEMLLMLGVNPVYDAPADLHFADALAKVSTTVHMGMYFDETAEMSHWHVNQAHYLETWSDARTYDGTLSIVQPMIDPLYAGKTIHDFLQALLPDAGLSAMSAVRANAKLADEAAWRKALHSGWVDGSSFTAKSVAAKAASLPAPVGSGLEISFKPDTGLYDGRFANIGWLQETPRQVTSLSWDNAALMSLETMSSLGLDENSIVEITLNGRSIRAGALMVPGHADGTITVHLGSGHRTGGRVAAGVGFNAYLVRTSDAPYYGVNATAKKVDGIFDLCVTKVHNIEHRGSFAQHDLEKPESDKDGVYSLAGHEAMERSIIRYATLAEVKANPKFAHEGGASGTLINKVGYAALGERQTDDETFFPTSWNYKKPEASTGGTTMQNAWGMAIDLNSCVGCNACIVSCYAENNIPVVGREQVKIGRNMQWIRIDTYFEGDLHAPKAHFQPMTCQHCENAGCEQVCPVGATVHTPEGINTMVYNRCVGTRYCSNNCPYKVRRFNFLLYSDYETESLKLMRNPDVSVRSRGVMEKCSYCIQRVEAVKIEADKENRAIADGEIVTACQQACPTDAISFGNINDPNSQVAKRKAQERDYQVLSDLNYRPRTTYTAGVINPNPELA